MSRINHYLISLAMQGAVKLSVMVVGCQKSVDGYTKKRLMNWILASQKLLGKLLNVIT